MTKVLAEAMPVVCESVTSIIVLFWNSPFLGRFSARSSWKNKCGGGIKKYTFYAFPRNPRELYQTDALG